MASQVRSLFARRQCLVWKTELPFRDRPRESPVFFFMNSEWSLKLTYYENPYDCYRILLVNKKGLRPRSEFRIETHLENERYYNGPLLTCYINVSASSTEIWCKTVDTIPSNIADFKKYGNLTIVCTFRAPADLVIPQEKRTDDKSVQASLEYPLTLKKIPFSLEETSLDTDSEEPSQSPSSELINSQSLNLVGLSEDFGKLLDRNLMPDVQLKCGEVTIPAHKSVLAARSEVFSAMFRHEMVENSKGIIDIKDIDPRVLGIFMKYLYSGRVPEDLTADMVPKLYTAGDKYALTTLCKVCSLFMASNLNEENFLNFLLLADTHCDDKLKDAVTEFITENEVLLTNNEWMDFSEQHLKLANEIYRHYVSKKITK